MDGIGTLTWDEFVKDAEDFVKVSQEIRDGWELIGDKNVPGMAYLSREVKRYVPCRWLNDDKTEDGEPTHDDCERSIEILSDEIEEQDPFEARSADERPLVTLHHVLWSLSYGVPMLYFNGWKSDFAGCNPISAEVAQKLIERDRLDYTELSQAMHPILARPFLQLHPCKSHELLKNASKSKNKLVSWLSAVAPAALRLSVHLDYFRLTVDERSRRYSMSEDAESEVTRS